MELAKQGYFDDEKYRRWLFTLGCVITENPEVQIAHIRRGANAGIGRKPPVWRCLPLSVEMHRIQGEIGELKFWYKYKGWERAVVLAKALYDVAYNDEAARKLINEWRDKP
jgi:hypothetical protein